MKPTRADLAFLRERFLSPDERKILSEVQHIPRKGLCICRRTGMNRSRFYNLVSNLVRRGVLRISEDGYELADERLKELLEK